MNYFDIKKFLTENKMTRNSRLLNENKIILNECFFYTQWKDVFDKYPQIIDILKNDEIIKSKGYISYIDNDINKIENIIDAFCVRAGEYGDFGPKDFTYPKVKEYLVYSTTKIQPEYRDFTEETLNKILPYIENYFKKYGNNISIDQWAKKQYDFLMKNKDENSSYIDWFKKEYNMND
jgi:hypothetical protein